MSVRIDRTIVPPISIAFASSVGPTSKNSTCHRPDNVQLMTNVASNCYHMSMGLITHSPWIDFSLAHHLDPWSPSIPLEPRTYAFFGYGCITSFDDKRMQTRRRRPHQRTTRGRTAASRISDPNGLADYERCHCVCNDMLPTSRTQ